MLLIFELDFTKAHYLSIHGSKGLESSSPGKTDTHLRLSLKKFGFSAWTMTTSNRSLQSFPTIYLIPLSLEQHVSPVSLTREGLTTFATFSVQFATVKANGNTGVSWKVAHNNLHEATGAVGDEKHLLAMIGQFGQHRAGLLSVADILFCEQEKNAQTQQWSPSVCRCFLNRACGSGTVLGTGGKESLKAAQLSVAHHYPIHREQDPASSV